MTHDDVFLRFQWQDRCGVVWTVGFTEEPWGFSGFMASRQIRGTGLVYVHTRVSGQIRPIAFLNDVRVDSHVEDRGLGSMLIKEAIEECMRRGHKGIYGYLSDVDIGRFPKLKYFYEKLGFSVAFHDMKRPDYRYDRAGKLEMVFDNVRDES